MRHGGGAVALARNRASRHRPLDTGEIGGIERHVERAKRVGKLLAPAP